MPAQARLMPAMKIVHLSRDEKFLPLMQALFEETFAGDNRWLVERPRRGELRFFSAVEPVRVRSSWCFRTRCIAKDIADADCVVVHGMTRPFARALRHVRPDCLVVWIGWGFDYMRLLDGCLQPLHLPATAALLGSLNPAKGGTVRHWLAPWLARAKAFFAQATQRPPALVSIAPRIDVFSANPADAGMLLPMLPQLRARQHNIPSFTVEDSFSQGPQQMAGPDVLLGNSATSSNNHVEALDWLRTRLPADGRLIVPLNYGNAHYARAVADAGRAALGARFEPLLDWMSLADYNQRIGRCGFVVMNHRRQQAMGNIGAALYKGATVYLRRDNPLFAFFTDLGVTLRAVEPLQDDPSLPLQPLSQAERKRNRELIEARYGRQRVVAAIRALESFKA